MFDTASKTALFLACVAGLSTIIGALIVVVTGRKNDRVLSMATGLASGVMLSAAFTDLLPEGEKYFSQYVSGTLCVIWPVAFMVIGILLAMVADILIPCPCGCTKDHHCRDSVGRIGTFTMLAIGLHNFPEGIALFFAGREDITLGLALTIAVVLHNIPGGITIAMPVYYSSGKKWKALLYTLIPSLVQPLGALVACLFLCNLMNEFVMGAMFSVVSGFLLFIALKELFPTALSRGHAREGLIATFTGVVLMMLAHLFG